MSKNIDVRFLVWSDLYHIKVEDLSCWGSASGKPAVIEITKPAYSKPIKKYFPQESVVYDSCSLDNTCDDCDGCDLQELPDGIYTIKVSASPSSFNYEVRYAKLDKMQRDIDLAFVSTLGDECTSCKKEKLIDFVFDKLRLEALVRSGDLSKGNEIYERLRKDLDKFLNCKGCK